MELSNEEMVLVEEVTKSADEVSALTDLQLALVGGGCGEVVFH